MSGYSAENTRMPEGYEQVLKNFMREVLRLQPADIEEFGLQYFAAKLDSGAPPPRREPVVHDAVANDKR
eukprot:scaffold4967_cov116-Isochrysis_galbana.AAC.10